MEAVKPTHAIVGEYFVPLHGSTDQFTLELTPQEREALKEFLTRFGRQIEALRGDCQSDQDQAQLTQYEQHNRSILRKIA